MTSASRARSRSARPGSAFASSACIAIATLGACFAPAAPAGAPCAPLGAAERCPSGLQCVTRGGVDTCEVSGAAPDADAELPDAAIDAPIDAATDGDRDGDEVLDADDNCADVANASQADEDRDGLGDVCDPCPPSTTNTDGDGDGVGDACDPNPTTPGDKLVAFEGFAAPLASGWTSSGSFTRTGGDGVLSAANNATSLLTRPSPAGARVEIRAAFVLEAITATGLNLGSVNVIERMQPSTDASVACQLAGLADGTQEMLRIFDGNALAAITSAAYAFAPGTAKELRLRRDATSYTCQVTSPTGAVAGTVAFSPASPRTGLRVRGAAARFRWVMITTSP